MHTDFNSDQGVCDISRLAGSVSQLVPSEGDQITAIAGLSLHRRNAITAPTHCIYGLGIGVTLQGRKQAMLGDEILTYAPGQSMVTCVDLPVISHVSQASVAKPFLGMMLRFDSTMVMQVAERMQLSQRMRDDAFSTDYRTSAGCRGAGRPAALDRTAGGTVAA